MKLAKQSVVTLTCLSMLLGQMAYAAGPQVVRDVALQGQGVLHGEVRDEQGAAQIGIKVVAVRDGAAMGVTTTDGAGRFQLTNLRGGVYEIQSEVGGGVYRLWAPRTAPPSAQDGLLLVANGDVVRQQGSCLAFLANPWVLAAIVATAIAVPLALDDDDAS